jgi:hypothetical protein
MEQTSNPAKAEYIINNTVYQVKGVFRSAPKAERLEDKIKRLILKDHEFKAALT